MPLIRLRLRIDWRQCWRCSPCQCDNREKVLYAAGWLQGSSSAWCDAYTTAHAASDTITWDEFTNNFRSHHIPSGVMKIKKKEFLSL
jgi:hypothetical protein